MMSLSCDVVPPGALEIWSELPWGVEEPGASRSRGVDAIAAVGLSTAYRARLWPKLRTRQNELWWW